MAEVNINIQGTGGLDKLNANLEKGANSVNTLKKELREVTLQIQGLDAGSEEFVKLSEKAGELRDKIKDTSEAINANAGPAFERLGNQFGLVAGKLATLDFGGAAESMIGLGSAVKSIKFDDLLKEAGKFFGAIGNFVKTNPLLAIVAVIALIIMNFEKLTQIIPGMSEALTGVTDEMKEQEKLATKQAEQSKKNLDAISQQEEVLKRNGKSEGEILKMKIDAAKVAVADAKAQLEAQQNIADAQLRTAKRNKEILKGILDFVSLPFTALLMGVDALTERLVKYGLISEETYKTVGNLRESFKESVSNLVFNPEEVEAEGKEAIEAAKNNFLNLENTLAGLQNRRDANAAAKRKEEEDKKKKEEEERLKREKELNKAILDATNERLNEEERLQEEAFQASLSPREKELQAVRDSYFEKITLAQQYGIDSTSLVEAQRIAEAEINKKYDDAAKAEADRLAKENQDREKKQFDDWKSGMQFRVGIANDVFNSLSQLTDAFGAKEGQRAKRNFQINKSLGIAQATMNTWAAANTILKDPTYVGPARFFAVAAAITAGLANVAKIAKTQFNPSGGGGGNGGGGGGAAMPSMTQVGGGNNNQPSFNPLNTSFLQNQPQQQPLQAFVLTTQVNSGLEAQARIREQTTL